MKDINPSDLADYCFKLLAEGNESFPDCLGDAETTYECLGRRDAIVWIMKEFLGAEDNYDGVIRCDGRMAIIDYEKAYEESLKK